MTDDLHDLDRAALKESSQTTVAVIGVGAIGTVLANCFTPETDVILCRRGNSSSMEIEEGESVQEVHARTVSSPSSLCPVDWIVLATKAQDVVNAHEWLDQLVGPSTRILVAQNGIGHAARVRRWASPDRVLPAIIYTNAERASANRVCLRKRNEVVLPESELALEFAELTNGYVPFVLDLDFDENAWRKLIMNVAVNSLTTLTERTAEVLHRPALAELVDTILEEGLSVARSGGMRFPSEEKANMTATISAIPTVASSSMQMDRRAGKTLEFEYISGALVQEADRLGIPVPAVSTIHALLAGVAQK